MALGEAKREILPSCPSVLDRLSRCALKAPLSGYPVVQNQPYVVRSVDDAVLGIAQLPSNGSNLLDGGLVNLFDGVVDVVV
ncbi:hypothetical protein L345_13938, partial [Ophiophagus hannah]